MKILILGVNGFIGNSLASHILENNGLGSLRHGHTGRQAGQVPRQAVLPLRRGRHIDKQGMDRVPREEVRRRPSAGGHSHARHLRQGAAEGVRPRFRGEPEDRPAVREVQQKADLPLHVGGLRHVPRRGIRRGRKPARGGAHQQAAMDLQRLEAAPRPGHLGLRLPERACASPSSGPSTG